MTSRPVYKLYVHIHVHVCDLFEKGPFQLLVIPPFCTGSQ